MLFRILDSAGERDGRCSVRDSLTTPIVQTATYFFKDTAELIAFQVVLGIQYFSEQYSFQAMLSLYSRYKKDSDPT